MCVFVTHAAMEHVPWLHRNLSPSVDFTPRFISLMTKTAAVFASSLCERQAWWAHTYTQTHIKIHTYENTRAQKLGSTKAFIWVKYESHSYITFAWPPELKLREKQNLQSEYFLYFVWIKLWMWCLQRPFQGALKVRNRGHKSLGLMQAGSTLPAAF